MPMASSSNDGNSRNVCVMDASGHLGSALVHFLLHRGYTVHAALQPHGHREFQSAEELLPCDSEKLRIFDADPFDYHSITNALKGCCGLFYCFEPPSDHSTYDEFMAEIEVRAAHNVLEACAQTDTMEKVVFTSSVTAVVWNEGRSTASSDLDEKNWTDIDFCKKFKLWHALSKTLAEKSAWALAMDRDINMVTINGGLLMTPDLNITNPYLKGAAEMYEDGIFVTADLRFITNAHICVFEDVSSYGRYICFNHVINCSHDADKLAQMLLPSSDSSPPQSWEKTRVYQQRISNRKLNNLMELENDKVLSN
ncbi:cinnamoyl-CoA reductase-like SNL6 isoform X2 [Hibiscus syriacus]|uniref:cinnamoyl-CoA reductase-like SNL6 isoform X2 n=1 Tax=Hibiscus syriacus TaxID=106335 RepID=UPI0019214E15|nr:cinnamoyl-CoA reductase-like SNL6 isoform X2 [Hibiscus syriacus]